MQLLISLLDVPVTHADPRCFTYVAGQPVLHRAIRDAERAFGDLRSTIVLATHRQAPYIEYFSRNLSHIFFRYDAESVAETLGDFRAEEPLVVASWSASYRVSFPTHTERARTELTHRSAAIGVSFYRKARHFYDASYSETFTCEVNNYTNLSVPDVRRDLGSRLW